ncbi:MAG: alpha/beta hydrolase, partial [Bryobacteraceae bacterium]
FTTAPLGPDIYVYSFTVDGLHIIDPANSFLKYNLLTSDSQVRVPGPATLPWEINNVPHGLLHHHPYHSAIAGDDREFIVYTPPGYNPKARKKLPVLYLIHGYSDPTDAWLTVGFANVILDNLIARGLAKPMLVVLPSAYGTMDVIKGGWAGVRNPGLLTRNQELFRDTLMREVIPQTESAYSVARGPANRAIAGLSLGGTESLFVGLNAPDQFGWVGAFSSGGLSTNFATTYPLSDGKLNSRLHLLWMSCGTEDRLVTVNHNLSDWLTAQGVRHEWNPMSGVHSFRVWRRALAQFAPLLFQPKN